jgi:hypothetical protein
MTLSPAHSGDDAMREKTDGEAETDCSVVKSRYVAGHFSGHVSRGLDESQTI